MLCTYAASKRTETMPFRWEQVQKRRLLYKNLRLALWPGEATGPFRRNIGEATAAATERSTWGLRKTREDGILQVCGMDG